jgi:phosphate transport system protein
MPELPMHTSHDFEADLRSVRSRFAEMSARCCDQIHLALSAFWTGSAEKAAAVDARDDEVNEDEKGLDELVLRVLALRQPVASDLRMLTACFKLITDLERVSDEAVGIARAAATGAPPSEMNIEHLKQMAAATEQIFPAATRSFLEKDEPLATQVSQMDVAIARLYPDAIADIIAFVPEHLDLAATTVNAMNVARCLERIADHAANIAEGTRFVIHDEQMPR